VNPLWSALLLFAASLALTLALGPQLIAFLRRAALRQHAYEDAPKTHATKSGTPTMGGLLFLVSLVFALLWHPDVATAALALLGIGCGLIGLADDLISIRSGRNRGLRARTKFLLTGVVAAVFLAFVTHAGGAQAPVAFAGGLFSSETSFFIVHRWVWYALAFCAILATTHAVNLTDGLDGLAGGTILPPLLLVAWLAWRLGTYGVSFTDLALAGSVVGFLFFNRHPARVFMGDTGALALGGVLAGSAILAGSVLLLPLIGGVFAAEALSVIVQVAYFKTTKKRIFRMSPLHHHFELGGWPETKVTRRFWTASALLSLFGAVLAR
jgi:phospho-N-acetylmuramoyl-pentapeptide-transferase